MHSPDKKAKKRTLRQTDSQTDAHNHGQAGYLMQRFSNWGPRTKGGSRRVPRGSTRVFPKIVIVCTVLTIYHSCVFKFFITLTLLAIHCNLYVTDDVDTFVKSAVHKNLGTW